MQSTLTANNQPTTDISEKRRFPCSICKRINLNIEGAYLIKALRYKDQRGENLEIHHKDKLMEIGVPSSYAQVNATITKDVGTFRGLHYQVKNAQSKYISVLHGSILDVGLDTRLGSPTFGNFFIEKISSETEPLESDNELASVANDFDPKGNWVVERRLFLPHGIAHGFLNMSQNSIIIYMQGDVYTPGSENAINVWKQPQILETLLKMSGNVQPHNMVDRDAKGPSLEEAEEKNILPHYKSRAFNL